MKRLVALLCLFGLLMFNIASFAQSNDKSQRAEECGVDELFYTVQLGVFSKQLPAEAFPEVASPVYYIKREDGLFAYFCGLYDDRFAAMRKRFHIAKTGSYDVYVASYFKREQINMVRADELIEIHGKDILYKPETVKI
jgi:hypothetical protein